DPIELAGLCEAFAPFALEPQSCPIGSVKGNIGHLEAAAGIAALTKVVLMLRHQELVPSLHAEELNPHIEFEKIPFRVQRGTERWKERGSLHSQHTSDTRRTFGLEASETAPRCAAISSFGAGGSNAHLIVEEYRAPTPSASSAISSTFSSSGAVGPQAIVLSARNAERLQAVARNLRDFLARRGNTVSLRGVAFTLQTGREDFDDRAGFVARDLSELRAGLERFLSCARGAGL